MVKLDQVDQIDSPPMAIPQPVPLTMHSPLHPSTSFNAAAGAGGQPPQQRFIDRPLVPDLKPRLDRALKALDEAVTERNEVMKELASEKVKSAQVHAELAEEKRKYSKLYAEMADLKGRLHARERRDLAAPAPPPNQLTPMAPPRVTRVVASTSHSPATNGFIHSQIQRPINPVSTPNNNALSGLDLQAMLSLPDASPYDSPQLQTPLLRAPMTSTASINFVPLRPPPPPHIRPVINHLRPVNSSNGPTTSGIYNSNRPSLSKGKSRRLRKDLPRQEIYPKTLKAMNRAMNAKSPTPELGSALSSLIGVGGVEFNSRHRNMQYAKDARDKDMRVRMAHSEYNAAVLKYHRVRTRSHEYRNTPLNKALIAKCNAEMKRIRTMLRECECGCQGAKPSTE